MFTVNTLLFSCHIASSLFHSYALPAGLRSTAIHAAAAHNRPHCLVLLLADMDVGAAPLAVPSSHFIVKSNGELVYRQKRRRKTLFSKSTQVGLSNSSMTHGNRRLLPKEKPLHILRGWRDERWNTPLHLCSQVCAISVFISWCEGAQVLMLYQ